MFIHIRSGVKVETNVKRIFKGKYKKKEREKHNTTNEIIPTKTRDPDQL